MQTRKALIDERMALSSAARQKHGEEVIARLIASIDLAPYATLGIYWPIRGETDVRGVARGHIDAGRHAALPVVVTRFAPLEFWRWHPGAGLRHDQAKIPIPEHRDVVTPDALLIPLVGFDPAGYRLGYGGGYYDRTLAAYTRRPFCIGLGIESACLPTIHPQPHDVRMDVIVTEQSIRWSDAAQRRDRSGGPASAP